MEDDASSKKPEWPVGQSVPTKNIIEDHQILSADEISLVYTGEVNSMYYNRLTFAIPQNGSKLMMAAECKENEMCGKKCWQRIRVIVKRRRVP